MPKRVASAKLPETPLSVVITGDSIELSCSARSMKNRETFINTLISAMIKSDPRRLITVNESCKEAKR